MKNRIAEAMTAFLLLLGAFSTLDAQHLHRHLVDENSNRIICYYTMTPNDRYIPPPEDYTSRLKSGQEAGAIFNFQIQNAPSVFADTAARMAGEIWGSFIYSPVPINIKIVFTDMDEGTLAGTTSPWPPYVLDNNGYLPERIYNQPLAEKFYRRNLNGNLPDMTMEYNKNVSWYFQTDGATSIGKFDFLSTLLHEMAHGLGFRGFFTVADEVGYGTSVPGAFDGFLENNLGERLSDTLIFPLGSVDLKQALTTPPVYFISPVIDKKVAGEDPGPKMYITNPWRSGNSLYHLDEIYDYKDGGENALMTHSTATGEAVHDPGPITTYMLHEMGWVHTYILHDTLKDRENLDEPFTVTAEIFGDKGIKSGSQYLFYSFNGFQTADSVQMTSTGKPNEFKADIPVSGLGITVQYYIKTKDLYDRVYTMPPQAPGHFYRFHVGPDITPPEIGHMPIQFMLTSNDSVEVKAKISDNLGLVITQVEYKINDVDQAPFDLEFDTLTDYRGYFVFSEGQLNPDDIIKYRIKAVDGSVSQNTTFDPASGYHEFKVEDVPPFVDVYTNDFESGLGDFLVDGFYHSKPSGFSSYGMHTAHPYPAPNRDNGELELKAQLKIPVRINPGDMFMRFDEIAYIESGEPGSKYGDEDFWDYVIVEGSKDGGNTWHNFILGWDCRYWRVWNEHFTDPLLQQQYLSLAVPDESAMRSHLVNLRAAPEFDDNDIILIRFRLYSDPYFAGWGWAIDNLEIHPIVVPVKEYSIIPDAIDVYPNPTTGLLHVSMQMKDEVEILEISLFDMVGKEVFTESYGTPGLVFNQYFDLNDLPNGLYLMKFTSGNQSVMRKIILAR